MKIDSITSLEWVSVLFPYELQNRLKARRNAVKVYVCHPGSSNTSLINDKAGFMTRKVWSLMTMTPLVQTSAQGAYPEIMCATEDNLKQRAYYGPTGIMNFRGPVGECNLKSFAYDEEVIAKLWKLSEKETSLTWTL
tara:strand:+ start:282 stop:692 length:411 start_codon:yes stop_codon:yes gene_type:complete